MELKAKMSTDWISLLDLKDYRLVDKLITSLNPHFQSHGPNYAEINERQCHVLDPSEHGQNKDLIGPYWSS